MAVELIVYMYTDHEVLFVSVSLVIALLLLF